MWSTYFTKAKRRNDPESAKSNRKTRESANDGGTRYGSSEEDENEGNVVTAEERVDGAERRVDEKDRTDEAKGRV